jgi:hypothetical protein
MGRQELISVLGTLMVGVGVVLLIVAGTLGPDRPKVPAKPPVDWDPVVPKMYIAPPTQNPDRP